MHARWQINEEHQIAVVGAGQGGSFDHTIKLKVIKLKEAMNGWDSNKWKEEIKINAKE